ncbi:MAG: hypothetical protein IE938_19285 [Pseudomonas balearica]|nr:hypothetical protein [Stutzerimonas balearica]
MNENDIEWPREIFMGEREDYDQGVVTAVLSEWATVPRFEGDDDRAFHRYVDGDILDSQERYFKAELEAARAQAVSLARAAFAAGYACGMDHDPDQGDFMQLSGESWSMEKAAILKDGAT